MNLRETVDDVQTLMQINEVLKPHEYTRLDKLIDIIFTTSLDVQLQNTSSILETEESGNKPSPVDFHSDCIKRINRHFDISFIKQSKSTYQSSDEEVGLTCAVSKTYSRKDSTGYWYAFHPHQQNFLLQYLKSYVSFGCGSPDHIIVIPLDGFMDLVKNMNKTIREDRYYWHVKFIKTGDKFEIEQPLAIGTKRKDISNFRI